MGWILAVLSVLALAVVSARRRVEREEMTHAEMVKTLRDMMPKRSFVKPGGGLS